MYCKNCGSRVESEDKFCSVCGCKQDVKTASGKSTAELIFKNKNAVICIVIILAVIIAIIAVINIPGKVEQQAENSAEKIVLTVDELPKETTTSFVDLSGTVETAGGTAILCINGDNVQTVKADEKWKAIMDLKAGKNKFVVTVSDGKGQSDTKIAEITYKKRLEFAEGTVLVKKDKSSIYLRPEPKISDKYVMHVPADDFETEFVCTGNEAEDEEGYLWVNVTMPENGTGWVRTDLMEEYTE